MFRRVPRARFDRAPWDASPVVFVEEPRMFDEIAYAAFAQCAALFGAEAPATAPQGGGAFSAIMMIFFVLIALFILIVLPNKSRDKQAQKLINSLKVNDKVLTTGGIIGSIYSIDKEAGEVVLRVDDTNNVKIKFAVSAIYFVYNKDAADKVAKDKASKDKASAKEKK